MMESLMIQPWFSCVQHDNLIITSTGGYIFIFLGIIVMVIVQ